MLKISDLLIKTYGNQSEVARLLGITRNTLMYHMNRDESRHFVIQEGDTYSLFTRRGAL